MENVNQLWNITKFLTTIKTPEVNELQAYYIQCCRQLSDDIELPKRFFGTGTMCSHCGSLWNNIDHRVRIIKGKSPSKSILKLINTANNSDQSILSKYQRKLMNKCRKNQSNKLVMTCSNCRRKTIIPLNKPKRLKREKSRDDTTTPMKKSKKKKKNKLKSTSLLINTPKTPCYNQLNNSNSNNSTPIMTASNKKPNKFNSVTSLTKSKKINLSKLKAIINTTTTPTKRSSLHSFLSELTQ